MGTKVPGSKESASANTESTELMSTWGGACG